MLIDTEAGRGKDTLAEEVRWIVQESPIYHRVEESLLYQNPLSVNSAKFSFSRYTTEFISNLFLPKKPVECFFT